MPAKPNGVVKALLNIVGQKKQPSENICLKSGTFLLLTFFCETVVDGVTMADASWRQGQMAELAGSQLLGKRATCPT